MSKADGLDLETSEQLCENHRNLRNKTKERLQSLFDATSLLRDFTGDVTPDEIAAEISIIKGDSIKVYIERGPHQRLKVIVSRTSKLSELKSAFRRTFLALKQRQKNAKHTKRSDKRSEPFANISWKYIWRTYYLRHNGIALTDNDKLLTDYGVSNKDSLDFVKITKIERRKTKSKTKR